MNSYQQLNLAFSAPSEFYYTDDDTTRRRAPSPPTGVTETRVANVEPGRFTRIIKMPADPSAPGRFLGDVCIMQRSKAFPLCYETSQTLADPYTIRLFTDASFPMPGKGMSTPSRPAGCSVVYRAWPSQSLLDWQCRGFQLHGTRDSGEAELHALVLGLETGAAISYLLPTCSSVQLHSDCKNAIRQFMSSEETYDHDPLVRRAVDAAKELFDRGVRVSVTWSPGHVGIPGNELADMYANAARHVKLDPLAQSAESTEFEVDAQHLAEQAGFSPRSSSPDSA